MVGHEAVGDDGDLVGLLVFFDEFEAVDVVGWGEEDGLSVVASVVDVVVVVGVEGVFSFWHFAIFNLREVRLVLVM